MFNQKERSKKYYKNNHKKELERCRKYRIDNREEINKRQRKRYKENAQFIGEYKLSKGCAICGYNKCPDALDFHHNGDKKFNISDAGYKNLEEIEKEMEKCTVLCRNCHAEENYKSRIQFKEKEIR